jgi:hypothetical protein
MAPEQATGEPGAASDWYSVGVMLYDAMLGRRPFMGSSESVLREKQRAEAPPPQLQRPDVPEDLAELCVDLLRRDPSQRPSGEEVLRRLGVDGDTPVTARTRGRLAAVSPPERGEPADDLVGRDAHLRALHSAFDATRRGVGETVFVHGSSGMGKTALVNHFLAEVGTDDQAVILSGRCYERESVPYKAVDSLIDALCRYLLSLPDAEADALMPRDVLMLAKVFPVLKRVEVFARARRRAAAALDPQEVRRRAFAALRDLLGRLAERRPLLLFIDDAQWGDADSAPLLDELMRPPDVPPLLLLLCYRTEDAGHSPLLSSLLKRGGAFDSLANAKDIELGPIDEASARALASRLLVRSGAGAAPAEVVARESGGHPYFIHELVQYARTVAIDETTALSLDAVIAHRVDLLDDEERRFLEAVAVAGKPVAQAIVQRAVSIDPGLRPSLIQKLRASQLVRSSGARDDDRVECYHDRIRETLLGLLDDDARQSHHRRLGYAYQATEHPDAETLVTHFFAAGEGEAAAEYSVEAARQAESALSFERAAQLYRLALEQRSLSDAERLELQTKHAEALLHAGRGNDSALAFVSASGLTTGTQALDLRRRAAEQYLRAGYLDEGLELIRQVSGEVGLRFPSTPLRGILGTLLRRAQLRVRGLGFRERSLDSISNTDVMPIDVCWSAATGLAQIDPARAGVFATRGLLLSLRLGEPERVARALLLEACFQASMGVGNKRRTSQLFDPAEKLCLDLGDPRSLALVAAIHGFVAFEQGRFAFSHEKCEEALDRLSEGTIGSAWELGSMQLFSLVSLVYMGDFRRVRRLAPGRLSDAQRRGDLYTTTNIRALISPALYMADDDPDAALREAAEAIEQWGVVDAFHNQHFMGLIMSAQAEIQRGDAKAAHQLFIDAERPLRKSLLLFVQVIRGYWMQARSVAALAAAGQGGHDMASAVKLARRDARTLEREKVDWTVAFGKMLRACIAHATGDDAAVVKHLRAAVDKFLAADMYLHAAACRLALGRRVGGSEGESLTELANAWFADQAVRRPERIAAGIVPLLFE